MLSRSMKIGFVVALAGVSAFLALRSSPYVQYIPWMPRRIGTWADSNGILRNTVAFFGLGFAALVAFPPRLWLVALLCVFAALVEVAQLWIPGRVYDPKDIVASVAGILLAWPVARLVRRRWSRY